jgi:MFS transporter, Spinster family, sphingosine-1-phosphate transporter
LSPRTKYSILLLLLAANLLNYIDRQILYAVFPLIKTDFNLSDTQLGFLGSAFMLSYMIFAPLLGWVGDHVRNSRLASGGLAFWSLSTAVSGIAGSYLTLLFSRSLVGIGEASFGVVSPGMLSDVFSKEVRGRILSFFYLAIPVGSAIGYLLGGILGYHFGWPAAFLLVALPGLLLAIPVWHIQITSHFPKKTKSRSSDSFSIQPYLALFRNRSYLFNALTMAAMTFAMGGLAQWIPTFITRYHHLNIMEANTAFGTITVVAGISGTLLGGLLGDLFQRKTKKGYLLVSAAGFFLSIPCCIFAILTPDLSACLFAIFLAECLLFLNTGPLNTIIVNVSQPLHRATAFALNIFLIHALGDAISPSVIGWCSDLYELRSALLIAPLFIFIALIFCLLCCRFIENDLSAVEANQVTIT